MIKDFIPFQQCDHVIVDCTDTGEITWLKQRYCDKCNNSGFYFDYTTQNNGTPKVLEGQAKPSLDLFKLLQFQPGDNIFVRDYGTPLNEYIGEKLTGNAIITRIQSEVIDSANMLIPLQTLDYHNRYLELTQTIDRIENCFIERIAPTTLLIGIKAILSDGTVITSTTELQINGN